MTSKGIIQSSLVEYFRSMVQKRVHELVEPLSNEQVWQRPFPYGNSIGNLVLHITGNLNYYIGAQIAGTGFIRHRDLEFSDSGKPKGDLLKAFDEAIQITAATVERQVDEDWSAAYSAAGETETKDRFTMFLRCAGHAYHHVGQIIYLQRELLRER
jgi:uncharacterized damage-inducible protein DinB